MSALKDYYRQIIETAIEVLKYGMESAKSTISNNIVEPVSDIIKMHKISVTILTSSHTLLPISWCRSRVLLEPPFDYVSWHFVVETAPNNKGVRRRNKRMPNKYLPVRCSSRREKHSVSLL
jgi:hypothetical protein